VKHRPIIAVTLSTHELPRMVHWRRMFEGLHECGATPLAVDCGTTVIDIAALIAHVDGLLISGGGDVDPRIYGADGADPTLSWVNPLRDANEIAAFEAASARGLPVLAICRGAQLVNAAEGGTLYLDLKRDRPSPIGHRLGEEGLTGVAHDVTLTPESTIARWMGLSEAPAPIAVNSQHHQGIRDLAASLRATAHAPDGLIEAYESNGGQLTGVQWHPEINWHDNAHARSLLTGFVEACAAIPNVNQPSGDADGTTSPCGRQLTDAIESTHA
jgi:putative glutamine amidotransferase